MPWATNARLSRASIEVVGGDTARAVDQLTALALDAVRGGEPGLGRAVAAVAGRSLVDIDPHAAAALLASARTWATDAPSLFFLGTHRILGPLLDSRVGVPEERLLQRLGREQLEAAEARGAGLSDAETAAFALDVLQRAGYRRS